MSLSEIFPSATIDENGFVATWTDFGFPTNDVPSQEDFAKAVLFNYSKVVPTESFFDFSQSPMSVVPLPLQGVNTGGKTFTRRGWAIYFFEEITVDALDPDNYVGAPGSGDGNGTGTGSGTPILSVEPWDDSLTGVVAASYGDRLWADDKITEVQLPDNTTDGDLVVFNNSNQLIDITGFPGTLTIPDEVTAILSSVNGKWSYSLSPSNADGIVYPPTPPVEFNLNNLSTETHLTPDIIDFIGTKGGTQAYSSDNLLQSVALTLPDTGTWGEPKSAADQGQNNFTLYESSGLSFFFDFDNDGSGRKVNISEFGLNGGSNFSDYSVERIRLYAGTGDNADVVSWTLIHGADFFPGELINSFYWFRFNSIQKQISPYRFLKVEFVEMTQSFVPVHEVKLGGSLHPGTLDY